MRTIALLSTIALAGFAAANPLLREASTAAVTYEETLQCAGCIRGGYVFCGKAKTGTKCMNPEDTAGIKVLQDDGWNCDNGVVAKPGYIAYDVCAEFNGAGCGSKGVENLLVDLNDNKTVTRDIFLEYSQGCAYRVVSTCGFPQMNITHKRYDVTIALHNDNQTQGDPIFNYEFPTNETVSYLHETVDGAFTYKYPGLDDNSTNNCGNVNNTVRKMYVMITNLQKPEPVTPVLAAQARMLADEVNKTFLNATVSFAAVEGSPDSAMSLFSAVAVAIVACLSVFVF